MNNKCWKVIESSYLLKNKWLTVRKDCVKMPNGIELDDFYILEYPNWINVIAITEEGDFVIERQYRHGTCSVEYEICAGVIEDGETPLEAAQRELYEETGYGDGYWTLYSVSAPNPAAMTNRNYTYLATCLKKISSQHLEATEDIDVLVLSPDKVKVLLVEGKISQGIMQAPLWKWFCENQK